MGWCDDCANCGEFFDLTRHEDVCPKCGAIQPDLCDSPNCAKVAEFGAHMINGFTVTSFVLCGECYLTKDFSNDSYDRLPEPNTSSEHAWEGARQIPLFAG